MAKKDKKSKKDKGENSKNTSKGSENAQIVRKLNGSIDLAKLQHVIMTKKGKPNKKGKKKDIKGIFIPIKNNFIFEHENGALYMDIGVHIKDQKDQYGQDGFISQGVPSDIYKNASDEEKQGMQNTPILGNVIDWGSGNVGNSQSSAPSVEVDEDDDLPF